MRFPRPSRTKAVAIALLGVTIGVMAWLFSPMHRPTGDLTPFVRSGCAVDPSESSHWLCPKDSPAEKLGCEYLAPDGRLASLTPQYPAMWCCHHCEHAGGLIHCSCGVVLYKDHQFVLIEPRPEALRPFFAPITSPQEAQAYATTASRDLFAREDHWRARVARRFGSRRYHTTHVEERADGYLVTLFSESREWNSALGGCVTSLNEVQVLATREGGVRRGNPVPASWTPGCRIY
jgi:hypothetical protein